MTMRERIAEFVGQRIVEPVWLSRAQRTAASYAPDQAAQLRKLAEAAQRRLDAAVELRDERNLTVALALLREAAALAITALLVARGEYSATQSLQPSEAWRRLLLLVESGQLSRAPPEIEQARIPLSSADPLVIDSLPADGAGEARQAAEVVMRWLQGMFEARSVRSLRRQRVLRAAFLVLALLGVPLLLIAWATGEENIARGKPVAQSSRRPGSPPASAAVDGVKDGTYGFCTNRQDSPWVRIDLLEPHKLAKVVVHNRGDGYFDAVLPLAIEISDDARHWQEVAARTTRFTEADPWKAKLSGKTARYVRLRKKGPGELWASEIEIYE